MNTATTPRYAGMAREGLYHLRMLQVAGFQPVSASPADLVEAARMARAARRLRVLQRSLLRDSEGAIRFPSSGKTLIASGTLAIAEAQFAAACDRIAGNGAHLLLFEDGSLPAATLMSRAAGQCPGEIELDIHTGGRSPPVQLRVRAPDGRWIGPDPAALERLVGPGLDDVMQSLRRAALQHVRESDAPLIGVIRLRADTPITEIEAQIQDPAPPVVAPKGLVTGTGERPPPVTAAGPLTLDAPGM